MHAAPVVATPEDCVDFVLERVGRRIVLGLPLGLGKAVHVANALYRRACADPAVELTVFTGLTLEAPRPSSMLERRFLEPLLERWYGDWPALDYVADMRADRLPGNVRIYDFFLFPGAWLNVPYAQRHYVSANYTHVDDVLIDLGVNVIAQAVAFEDAAGVPRYSLASNPDLTLDVLPSMRLRLGRGRSVFIGQVSRSLPFMEGDAAIEGDSFDLLLDGPGLEQSPFPAPSRPVALAELAIGLRVAALVKDGGTLQLGIGSIADAVCHGLLLRHRDTGTYEALLERLGCAEEAPSPETGRFEIGLYGASELLVPGFLALIDAGVVARRVPREIAGELREVLIDAAFYLGPADFYERLRAMPLAERRAINMTAVSFVNELYGDEERKRAERRDARFVNNALLAMLDGSVVSDALDEGRVVSGVGGQYNFVAQAHALEGASSIVVLPATRTSGGETRSNVVWEYPRTTIPRHLRDVVVTEYGAARLRRRSDRDVAAALIEIADTRFQEALLERAQRAGKIERGYRIPEHRRGNTPERLRERLLGGGHGDALPHFPLGADFSDAEARLAVALGWLKQRAGSRRELAGLAVAGGDRRRHAASLERMGLGRPRGLRERLYARLLAAALDRAGIDERPLFNP